MAGRRAAAGGWIPDQHGAWAMLAVPYLAGTLLAPRPGPQHVLLFAAWLLGYAAAFHAQQWLRLRTRGLRSARRHARPAVVFGAAFAAAALPVAAAYPWLVAAGALAAPFVAVNTWFAWRGRERALANGLAAVLPACGMLLVAARLGGAGLPWAAALACLLYFAGTVPYVKTMIRERNSRAYYRGSVAYHAAALAVAGCLAPWLALPFAAYLARAAALPGRALKPPAVGAVELCCSAALLAAVVLLF
ncbi:YwiC-like family protein [Streptomyces sp. NPDC091268]|uniref:YwiC-like family protein n=1 Tax=Streptomyces sp. NPDC091268 TaxID=3365979 RepID=UPI003830561D